MNGFASFRTLSWPPNTLLSSLSPETVKALIGERAPRWFRTGQPIVREGDPGTYVAVLLSGFAKVTTSAEGTDVLLAIRSPGELVGETGALTGRPRNATATACGQLAAVIVPADEFDALQRHHSDLRKRVLEALAVQLDWANRRRTDFAVYPAHVRLARVLLEIADACGRPIADDAVEIMVPLSQTELAAMIAIGRATVEKAIQELKGGHLIKTGYRRLILLDIPGLRDVAAGPDI